MATDNDNDADTNSSWKPYPFDIAVIIGPPRSGKSTFASLLRDRMWQAHQRSVILYDESFHSTQPTFDEYPLMNATVMRQARLCYVFVVKQWRDLPAWFPWHKYSGRPGFVGYERIEYDFVFASARLWCGFRRGALARFTNDDVPVILGSDTEDDTWYYNAIDGQRRVRPVYMTNANGIAQPQEAPTAAAATMNVMNVPLEVAAMLVAKSDSSAVINGVLYPWNPAPFKRAVVIGPPKSGKTLFAMMLKDRTSKLHPHKRVFGSHHVIVYDECFPDHAETDPYPSTSFIFVVQSWNQLPAWFPWSASVDEDLVVYTRSLEDPKSVPKLPLWYQFCRGNFVRRPHGDLVSIFYGAWDEIYHTAPIMETMTLCDSQSPAKLPNSQNKCACGGGKHVVVARGSNGIYVLVCPKKVLATDDAAPPPYTVYNKQ